MPVSKATAKPAYTRKKTQPQNDGKLPVVIPMRDDAGNDVAYEDDDLVTVLYNYGEVSEKQVIWLGRVKFVGGVATDVPWHTVKHWVNGTRPIYENGQETERVATSYFRVRNMVVAPWDTDPLDYPKMAGREVNTNELARALGATDMNELINVLGVQRAEEILATLQKAVAARETSEK